MSATKTAEYYDTAERHDAVVIGAGAAGLSAALVLGRARRRVGPMPSMSSKIECTCPLLRRLRWYSMAKRCASS